MINILKKYWVVIPIIIAPILINWLLLKPKIFDFVGDDSTWLNFWGTYIGTVLSTMVAFYVLYKQMEQNHTENRNNRELQISILEYQIKSQWLTELKSKMVDVYNAFSQNDLTMLGDSYGNYGNNQYIIKEIKRISDKMKDADFAKGLLFPKDIDRNESKFLARLHGYEEEFNALLEDLNWLAHLNGNDKFRTDSNFRNEIIQNYKERAKQFNNIKSRRAWELIDFGATKISIITIANLRIKEGIENISPDEIMFVTSKLIDYEQEKINKILNINGTE